MRIGIDLDGVVFNTEIMWATYAELYDVLDLKRNSLINKDEATVQKKYNWSKEEIEEYFKKYVYDIDIELMPGAKEVLDLLKEDGHKFIVITARGKLRDDSLQVVYDKVHEFGLTFDKYSFGNNSKLASCKKENIDLMIDDNYYVCKELSENNIKCLYFHSLGRKHIIDDKNITEVYNWGEVYRYIHDISKNSVKKIAK